VACDGEGGLYRWWARGVMSDGVQTISQEVLYELLLYGRKYRRLLGLVCLL
jgi:hypothetical protein